MNPSKYKTACVLSILTFLMLVVGLLNVYYQSAYWAGSGDRPLSLFELVFSLACVVTFGSFFAGIFWLIDFVRCRLIAHQGRVGFYKKWLIGLILSVVLCLWILSAII